VLFDLGLVNTREPFQRLVNQGMITSFAYQRKDKFLVSIDMVEEIEPEVFIEKATGARLERVIAKMSKSLKNVINPDDIIHDYGADSMRMYEMFMGPLQVSKPWSTSGLSGVHRFLERIWRLASERELVAESDQAPEELIKVLHKTLKKVSHDTAALEFNTAIAQMMIFINELYKADRLYLEVWEPFILILAPYAPHMAEELWEKLGHKNSLAFEPWPQWDEDLTKEQVSQIVLQVNGKVRAKFDQPVGLDQDSLREKALANERIQEWIKEKTIIKIIVVPDRLVNIVVR
jgi:leucyl-tRNA synthetase